MAASVAEVKGKLVRVAGWVAEFPTEPMLKPEAAVWDVPPPVNEKPPEVVAGVAEVEAVLEPNTKLVGAVPWLEVAVLEMALVRVLLPRPKPLGFAVAGVAAVLPRLSFGVLRPKEKPELLAAGMLVPKLNPGVCVVRENSPVEGVLAAGWEEVPKLKPPVPDAEKEKPVEGVVVVVVAALAVPNMNPPVLAPVPPKLNPLMVSVLVATAAPAPAVLAGSANWEGVQSRGSKKVRWQSGQTRPGHAGREGAGLGHLDTQHRCLLTRHKGPPRSPRWIRSAWGRPSALQSESKCLETTPRSHVTWGAQQPHP